ncbi:ABC transporter substrate-binding protein [Actinocorallia sp. API 0066]|uniref:ABC transporter substrate-binding protein n=1 Tax=Actinocorallia sp. API 0066 TaxID=2896846 RepID=UPI001E5226CA|nr:ABC transporter substrate-binding protein [Actinocorallia sp. API 0066]MCD0451634.1 ABC transporter substrate-binding protein [Actinocorallia sp. API 0066]
MTATAWLTRCPVPTASGVAHRLGWLDGFAVLPDALAARHLDHELPGLFREGGNVPALAARASGAPTRLIGLTWIEERQLIVAARGSGIRGPADLAGRRAALPVPGPEPGAGVMRAMALAGFAGALAAAGHGLDAVAFTEVPDAREGAAWTVNGAQPFPWTGLAAVAGGEADVAYVKGPVALARARAMGLEIAVDLDRLPERRFRVNNGTPRPLTVHADTLRDRPGLVVEFLAATLRAAAWAADHPEELRDLLRGETGGDAGPLDPHGLRPGLSAGRRALLRAQHGFLRAHGFLHRDVDLDAWTDPEPLRLAHDLLRSTA